MDNQQQHIDSLLRAAANAAVPGAGRPEKQAAWNDMAKMLDKRDKKRPVMWMTMAAAVFSGMMIVMGAVLLVQHKEKKTMKGQSAVKVVEKKVEEKRNDSIVDTVSINSTNVVNRISHTTTSDSDSNNIVNNSKNNVVSTSSTFSDSSDSSNSSIFSDFANGVAGTSGWNLHDLTPRQKISRRLENKPTELSLKNYEERSSKNRSLPNINLQFSLVQASRTGLHLGFQFRQPITENLSLQPFFGIGYQLMNKSLIHSQIQLSKALDSTVTLMNLDTIHTRLRLKDHLSANVGLAINYTKDKFTFGIGAQYSRILSNKSDTTRSTTISRIVVATPDLKATRAYKNTPLPGNAALSLTTSISYQWTNWLNTGIGYRMQVWKNTATEWNSNASILEKNNFEIFVRFPLKR